MGLPRQQRCTRATLLAWIAGRDGEATEDELIEAFGPGRYTAAIDAAEEDGLAAVVGRRGGSPLWRLSEHGRWLAGQPAERPPCAPGPADHVADAGRIARAAPEPAPAPEPAVPAPAPTPVAVAPAPRLTMPARRPVCASASTSTCPSAATRVRRPPARELFAWIGPAGATKQDMVTHLGTGWRALVYAAADVGALVGDQHDTGGRVRWFLAGTAPRAPEPKPARPPVRRPDPRPRPPRPMPPIRPAPPSKEEERVARWLPLVKHIAARLALGLPSHIDIDDLVAYGTFGLLDALAKYDPTRGVKFETYAYMRIKGQMVDGLRGMDWAPAKLRTDARALEEAVWRLQGDLGREPTAAEVAAAMGISVAARDRLAADVGRAAILSLDEMWSGEGEDGEFTLRDLMQDPMATDPVDAAISTDERERLAAMLATLPPKELRAIELLYYGGMAPREAAQAMHLSVSRISQLHTNAVLRLRGIAGVSVGERPAWQTVNRPAKRPVSPHPSAAIRAGWARRKAAAVSAAAG